MRSAPAPPPLPFPSRNGRRTEPPPPPLMAHRPSSATASPRPLHFPIRPIKGQHHPLLHPHRSPSLPRTHSAAAPKGPVGAPPLTVDPLLRRLSLPSELAGDFPLSSSSFLCFPRRIWWPGGPVGRRRRAGRRAAAARCCAPPPGRQPWLPNHARASTAARSEPTAQINSSSLVNSHIPVNPRSSRSSCRNTPAVSNIIKRPFHLIRSLQLGPGFLNETPELLSFST
jgi:hypothetical protein